MQKHALALGYFFLAVFCVFVSPNSYSFLRFPLLLAAFTAALAGCGILLSACAVQLHAGKTWLVQIIRKAQQPPVHDANPRNTKTT